MHARTLSILALTALALLVAPAAAAAHTATVEGLAKYATWADGWHVPLPPGPLTVHDAPCPGDASFRGCAVPETGDVYVDGTELVFAHEVGHVWDRRVLGPLVLDERFYVVATGRRGRLTRLLGYRQGRRWLDAGATPPAERFADAYALCAMRGARAVRRSRGAIVGGGESVYGYAPSPEQHRAICRTIRAASRALDSV